MRTIRQLLINISDKTTRQQGFITASILLDWPTIVGAAFAELCQPLKISFPPNKKREGRLHVMTSSAFAVQISYLEPQIIEKINSYFGYKAVQKLLIRNGEMPKKISSKKEYVITDHDRQTVEQPIATIDDPEIKQRLLAIGLGIYRHEKN